MENIQQDVTIGNPVDAWWNATRKELPLVIDLLAQFPPAPNVPVAENLLVSVCQTYDTLKNAPFPPQANKAREFLLESLVYLIESLREQVALGLKVSESSHNMAYHKFLMVSFKLIQRGIYEPAPSKQIKVTYS